MCSRSRPALTAPVRAAPRSPIAARSGSANPAGARRRLAGAFQPRQRQAGPLPRPASPREHVPQRAFRQPQRLHQPCQPARFGRQRPQPRQRVRRPRYPSGCSVVARQLLRAGPLPLPADPVPVSVRAARFRRPHSAPPRPDLAAVAGMVGEGEGRGGGEGDEAAGRRPLPWSRPWSRGRETGRGFRPRSIASAGDLRENQRVRANLPRGTGGTGGDSRRRPLLTDEDRPGGQARDEVRPGFPSRPVIASAGESRALDTIPIPMTDRCRSAPSPAGDDPHRAPRRRAPEGDRPRWPHRASPS